MLDARPINQRLPVAQIGIGSAHGWTPMMLFTEPDQLRICSARPPLGVAFAAALRPL